MAMAVYGECVCVLKDGRNSANVVKKIVRTFATAHTRASLNKMSSFNVNFIRMCSHE